MVWWMKLVLQSLELYAAHWNITGTHIIGTLCNFTFLAETIHVSSYPKWFKSAPSLLDFGINIPSNYGFSSRSSSQSSSHRPSTWGQSPLDFDKNNWLRPTPTRAPTPQFCSEHYISQFNFILLKLSKLKKKWASHNIGNIGQCHSDNV